MFVTLLSIYCLLSFPGRNGDSLTQLPQFLRPYALTEVIKRVPWGYHFPSKLSLELPSLAAVNSRGPGMDSQAVQWEQLWMLRLTSAGAGMQQSWAAPPMLTTTNPFSLSGCEQGLIRNWICFEQRTEHCKTQLVQRQACLSEPDKAVITALYHPKWVH